MAKSIDEIILTLQNEVSQKSEEAKLRKVQGLIEERLFELRAQEQETA